MEKADYARFWDGFKEVEEVVSVTTEPLAIEIFGDGNVAVIHSLSEEALIWKGEPLPNGGDTIAAGDTFTVRLRWSDFWVKEDGRWLTVGGHRDKVCLLADDLLKDPDEACEE